jgi:hypothetical protein
LARDWVVTVQAGGPDPYLGFYHQPRSGQPALALDLVEEFRPLIGGSVALTAVNICGHLTHLAVVDRDADRQVSLSAGCKKGRTGGKGVGSRCCEALRPSEACSGCRQQVSLEGLVAQKTPDPFSTIGRWFRDAS